MRQFLSYLSRLDVFVVMCEDHEQQTRHKCIGVSFTECGAKTLAAKHSKERFLSSESEKWFAQWYIQRIRVRLF